MKRYIFGCFVLIVLAAISYGRPTTQESIGICRIHASDVTVWDASGHPLAGRCILCHGTGLCHKFAPGPDPRGPQDTLFPGGGQFETHFDGYTQCIACRGTGRSYYWEPVVIVPENEASD